MKLFSFDAEDATLGIEAHDHDLALRAPVVDPGITVTPLRPIGRVRFGTEEVDVMTEGEYVDTNQEVEVTSVQGPRVVVRVPDPT